MDDAIKRELIANLAPAVVVPVARAAMNHHYTMKQMEKQEEMAVNVAERKAESVRELARVNGGNGQPASPGGIQRSSPTSPGDVYNELESLREETDCGFCHDVIESLMDAPPEEARRGYDELRSYVREADRVKDQNLSQSEAEEIIGNVVEQWEVVPQYAAGVA